MHMVLLGHAMAVKQHGVDGEAGEETLAIVLRWHWMAHATREEGSTVGTKQVARVHYHGFCLSTWNFVPNHRIVYSEAVNSCGCVMCGC